jgi:ribosomal protein L16 Arg81 hydroxylase
VALPLSVGEWIIQYWKEHTEQYRKRPVDQRPLECTTHPGDVLFVPHGWWHSVINLDESNIAITHNYVSPSNLGNALKFFREKQDQISGCRDRTESIKPEFIHDALVEALKVKEPNHLERAMQQTKWTCRAWEETKAEVITDDDENNKDSSGRDAPLAKNKKRRIDNGHDRNEQGTKSEKEELSSVMSKTERVSAFSFSFL